MDNTRSTHASAPLLAMILLLTAGLIGCRNTPDNTRTDLRQVFAHPPESAKPRGYWVWPNGHFDYATIRKELRAFKEKGLGGVDIFDLGVRDDRDVIPPGPGFLSPEQVDGIAFALEEAKKLGLQLGLIVSSSWNAGGTWTPPELASMNMVAWRDTIEGPVTYSRQLPVPELPETFSKPYGVYPLTPPKTADGRPVFYEDVAVLLAPAYEGGSVHLDTSDVSVLTDRLNINEELTVNIPAGTWELFRFGVTNFGQRLWLPSDGSQGLIMDHFSREATRHHFQTVIDRLEQRVGSLENTALERLYLASYESNADIIWTPGFETVFVERNGYLIEPFLPALFGRIVQTPEITERFLYDYRLTASDLFVENLYREASRICKKHGLLLCSEAGGPGPPLHDVPTEDLKALGAVDVMRGEFWNREDRWTDDEGFNLTHVVKGIASAAHIYGHRIVEMEAFTSHIHWQEGPDVFKPLADRAFAEGMNRVVYHTMSHNIPAAGKPGWTYQAGTHMSTNLTWWDLSDQLHAYLARCSALLQQGTFVADVAYYYGHEIPNFTKPKHVRPALEFGYDYDDLNTEILLQASVDGEGRIVLPGGMTYTLLVLPEDRRMELVVLEKIVELLRQGAYIAGPKPDRTYTLRDYPNRDRQLRKLAIEVWGEGTNTDPYSRSLGEGRMFVNQEERTILDTLGVPPDVRIYPDSVQNRIDFFHRQTGGEDIYFLYNRDSAAVDMDVQFRIHNRQPEFWDAVTGSTVAVAVYIDAGEGVRLPVYLPGHGSIFVVFTEDRIEAPHITSVRHAGMQLFPTESTAPLSFSAMYENNGRLIIEGRKSGLYDLVLSNGEQRSVNVEEPVAAVELNGPWEVHFPAGWGAQSVQTFDSLHSWTNTEDAGTRVFSGIAVYRNTFTIDTSDWPGSYRATLELGKVKEVAHVMLNGQDVGLSSFFPHNLDVTDHIQHGENFLTVEVANTWLNRLIADDHLPPEARLTHTNLVNGPTSDRPWRMAVPKPSGLLGPVIVTIDKPVKLTSH